MLAPKAGIPETANIKQQPMRLPNKIHSIVLVCPKDARYPIFPVYKSKPYQRIMSKPTVKNIAENGKETCFRARNIIAPIAIDTPASIERINGFPIE
jgi:hypothetical protein